MAQAQPPPEEVRAQLDRLFRSDPFSASTRLQRFLSYVVEQSLAGKADELKEYSIGTAVFDRGDQYDPRIDSIVRVEAGRLRSKLDEYYNGAGAFDAVMIRIPRGTYAPVLERREVGAVAEAVGVSESRQRIGIGRWRAVLAASGAVLLLTAITAWRMGAPSRTKGSLPAVTVAVLPFAHYSTDPSAQLLAARLTDGVTGELARFGTVGVVSHTSAMQFEGTRQPLKEIARALSADGVVEASVDVDGDIVRVQARLVDAVVDRKSFSQAFEGSRAALPDLQQRIASAIEKDARLTLIPARH